MKLQMKFENGIEISFSIPFLIFMLRGKVKNFMLGRRKNFLTALLTEVGKFV